jgi:hypothetical protein
LTSPSFAALNNWYLRSHVIYTDNLTPITTNLGIRIVINAMEMYVPFTLNFSSDAAATTATNTTTHFESSRQMIIFGVPQVARA